MSEIHEINSAWAWETGKWDEGQFTFIDRKYRTNEKIIKVVLKDRGDKKLVQFIGGPTGFECYEFDSLKESVSGEGEFCLCEGSCNSWPRCMVRSADLKVILGKM